MCGHHYYLKGNKCAIFRANSLGPEASLESTVYKFGDMLLRPSARLAKRVFKLSNLNLKPALYTEYRLRRKSQLSYDGPSTSSRAVQSSGSGHAYDTEQKIDELEVWGLFFDDICTIGVSLCQNTYQQTGLTCSEEEGKLEAAWITVDDIDLQEPFLFIGLPACALFKTIFRSFSDTDGIVLMNAQRVVRETCPESFREMFDMLMVTKTSLVDIEQGTETGNGKEKGPHLQQADLLWMQQFLLYSSSDQEITITPERGGPSLERQTQFRHALSHLVGVCIQLTQQPYFKENFMNVLEEISHRVSV